MPLQCTCPTCGAAFTKPPSSKQVYCRPDCRPWNRPLADHFWAGVNKDGPIVRPDLGSCWVWTRALFVNYGYGAFWDGKQVVRAHRFSWELENGPVPSGLRVLHRCDNPPCVRPSHLFVGTQQDNVDDMFAKGRMGGWNIDRSLAQHGETHHSARLKESDVREIRRRADLGESLTVLAREYRVSVHTTHCIARRKTWKHVE